MITKKEISRIECGWIDVDTERELKRDFCHLIHREDGFLIYEHRGKDAIKNEDTGIEEVQNTFSRQVWPMSVHPVGDVVYIDGAGKTPSYYVLRIHETCVGRYKTRKEVVDIQEWILEQSAMYIKRINQ